MWTLINNLSKPFRILQAFHDRYFVSKIVMSYYEKKKCSSDREKLLIFETEFATHFEITKTIYSNSERSDQFLKQNVFLTCSWRFLRSDILEQL